MAETNTMIRRFERMVFSGVPEIPETSHERQGYGNVNGRETGRAAQDNGSIDLDDNDLIVVANVIRYLDKEKTDIEYIACSVL